MWLGLLALPMILFHGGFHFGGTLTAILMWLLIITVASGVYGALLQNSIPKKMTSEIPLETIYDEISHVRRLLRDEADRAVESLCGNFGIGEGCGTAKCSVQEDLRHCGQLLRVPRRCGLPQR